MLGVDQYSKPTALPLKNEVDSSSDAANFVLIALATIKPSTAALTIPPANPAPDKRYKVY